MTKSKCGSNTTRLHLRHWCIIDLQIVCHIVSYFFPEKWCICLPLKSQFTSTQLTITPSTEIIIAELTILNRAHNYLGQCLLWELQFTIWAVLGKSWFGHMDRWKGQVRIASNISIYSFPCSCHSKIYLSEDWVGVAQPPKQLSAPHILSFHSSWHSHYFYSFWSCYFCCSYYHCHTHCCCSHWSAFY